MSAKGGGETITCDLMASGTPNSSRLPSATQREQILDVAGELLATRGLCAMTVEAIAARSHQSRRTIERWWPCEEALAAEVLLRESAAVARHAQSEQAGDGTDQAFGRHSLDGRL